MLLLFITNLISLFIKWLGHQHLGSRFVSFLWTYSYLVHTNLYTLILYTLTYLIHVPKAKGLGEFFLDGRLNGKCYKQWIQGTHSVLGEKGSSVPSLVRFIATPFTVSWHPHSQGLCKSFGVIPSFTHFLWLSF